MGGNIEVIFRREADRANTNDSRPSSSSRREASSHSYVMLYDFHPGGEDVQLTCYLLLNVAVTHLVIVDVREPKTIRLASSTCLANFSQICPERPRKIWIIMPLCEYRIYACT